MIQTSPITDQPQPVTRTSRLPRYLVLLALLLLAAYLLRGRLHFDWAAFSRQFRSVSWARVAAAVACIYVGYWLRAMRWAVLVRPVRRATALELLPAQLISFTAVALFGRVADLARPYLIARRLQTPVATQVAIYSIERAFDLAAAAILFSVTLAFAPRDLPHHEAFARTGALSMLAVALLAACAVTVRLRGDQLAALIGRLLRPLSARFAALAAQRVLDLREGFGVLSSVGEFAATLALSLIMWAGIAACYLLCATSFRATPQLAGFSLTATMLLLATGIGGSILQLPVLGWFTQIAVLATALHTLFGVPLEAASACAAVNLFATTLSIVPAGLLASRLQGITLREAAPTRP